MAPLQSVVISMALVGLAGVATIGARVMWALRKGDDEASHFLWNNLADLLAFSQYLTGAVLLELIGSSAHLI